MEHLRHTYSQIYPYFMANLSPNHLQIIPNVSLILARLFMETRVQKFSIFVFSTPKNIDFFSTSNSDSPRNLLQNELSLTSVREFLRKIERNYVFAGNFG